MNYVLFFSGVVAGVILMKILKKIFIRSNKELVDQLKMALEDNISASTELLSKLKTKR